MPLTWKDAAATLATALAVLVFAASHEGWDVALVGDSRRWAAGAILLLGMVGCTMGTQRTGSGGALLTVLGVATLGLAIAAIATGSPTVVSLLTACVVLLWLASTVRHARPHRTVTA